MTKQTRLWVSPKFKKMLKKQAVEKEISILELTRQLGDESELIKIKNEKEKKKFMPKF